MIHGGTRPQDPTTSRPSTQDPRPHDPKTHPPMNKQPVSKSRILGVAAATLALWAGAAALGLGIGSTELGGVDLFGRLLSGELTDTEYTILTHARVPRVVFAGLVGAALAVGGAVFQAVLRNPLADPYILGISGGAALGGTVMLVLGTLTVGAIAVGVPLGAFAGAMAALAVIFGVEKATPASRGSTYVLLLTGVIVNAFAASLIMFLQSVVTARQAQEILFYLMGALSVEGTSPAVMATVAVVMALSVLIIYRYANALNAVSLGDEDAAALGVEVKRVRTVTVTVASLAVAVAVAFSGIIGFVGLVVPHAIRLVVGPDHRVLIPACAFGGAAFLTVADLMARGGFGLIGTTLPVGVLTSMIGAPLFLYFLWRSFQQSSRWS